MSEIASNPRRGLPIPQRLFIDATRPVEAVAAGDADSVSVEVAILRRLLDAKDLRPVAVMRRDDRLHTVDSGELNRFLTTDHPGFLSSVLHAPPSKPAVVGPEPRPGASAGLRRRITGGLRGVARAAVARAPASMREDLRGILIHSRQILRAAAYGRPAPPQLPPPPPPPAPSGPRAPRLGPVVHARAKDLVWTAARDWEPGFLRAIAGLEAPVRPRVIVLAGDQRGAALAIAGLADVETAAMAAAAMDILGSAELVIAPDEGTRSALHEIAAAVGKPVPRIRLLAGGAEVPLRAPPLPSPPAGRRTVLLRVDPNGREAVEAILSLWDAMAAEPGFGIDLLLLGPVPPDDPLAGRIAASPHFGTRVFWVEKVAEDAVDRLFRAAAAVLCAGRGTASRQDALRAVRHGRPAIAPAGLEVTAGAILRVAEPSDPASWRDAILAAMTAPRPGLQAEDAPALAAAVEAMLRDWARAAAEG